ncbi:hypothetical protein K7X08_035670 [Anisodus acutangulus]|uniref:Uncharacterized protein n=1 Tax=Anisodus acutangulus TaxID=402998 RepID=A0A9Q1RI01_9SOLA|nr:hypothetical protein K7X08_035670 [Anisodus acutangulus]
MVLSAEVLLQILCGSTSKTLLSLKNSLDVAAIPRFQGWYENRSFPSFSCLRGQNILLPGIRTIEDLLCKSRMFLPIVNMREVMKKAEAKQVLTDTIATIECSEVLMRGGRDLHEGRVLFAHYSALNFAGHTL